MEAQAHIVAPLNPGESSGGGIGSTPVISYRTARGSPGQTAARAEMEGLARAAHLSAARPALPNLHRLGQGRPFLSAPAPWP